MCDFANRFDKVVEKIFNENKIAGMSVAVTDREKIVYAKGFGSENIEREGLDSSEYTLYRIASVTKVFTGITIMALAERGILELDKPIKNYLPTLKLSRDEALTNMTLRHLLSHTAGFPKGKIIEGPRDESGVGELIEESFKTLEINTLPEEKVFNYSNWGIVLAGHVATSVTGKPFSVLAKEYVLDPLGLERTTFDVHKALTYPFSLPHQVNENGEFEVIHYIRKNAIFHPSGGLYSNAVELCKLARFLLNGGKNDKGEQVLGSEYLNSMFTVHGQRDNGDYYGLTMHIHKHKNRTLYGHLGDSKPYSISVFTDRESGLGVVTLMNTKNSPLRFSVPEMIFDALDTI